MKNLLLVLFFIAAHLNIYAQKEDYIWYLGYLPNEPEQKFGGTKIDFHQSPPEIAHFEIGLSLIPSVGMISNPAGKVQFYSNGCSVANAENQIMPNGDGISPGQIADVYCPIQGYPAVNGVMALPKLGNTGKYILFHIRADNSTLYKDLLSTEIDMNLDNELGDVTNKNQIILQDTFSSFLTAVRHGNGRDWWVMLHKNRSNRSLCYLLGPGGLHAPVVQHLGPKWNYQDWSGQSVFSPDGSKYARGNPYNGLHIFDFDRCTGTLSNQLVIGLAADSAGACGVAFSPNSRFLYLSTGTKLFQFDMQAADIAASKQLIDVYDGFLAPFPTTFYQQRLAPDGKIYMAATNSSNFLHVINNPDLPGLECDFAQHSLETPTQFAQGLPNFPYFRLYDLPGSPCDTLGINGGPVSSGEPGEERKGFVVAPNPVSDEVNVRFQQPFTGTLTLLDAFGKSVRQVAVSETMFVAIVCQGLPNGIYYLQAQGDNQKPQSTKFVIAH